MATMSTVSGSNYEFKKKPKEKKKASDRIVGSNWCTMFLYNIPRGSLMVTFPGLVILVTGAAMTGYIDSGRSWTDGLALIALICLCVGGVWTLGGIAFWIGAWCRYKPPMQKSAADPNPNRSSVIVVDGIGNVHLESVVTYPAFDNDITTASEPYARSQSKAPMVVESSTDDIAMSDIAIDDGEASMSYQAEAYPDETVFTVP